jgi:hypothetical protein
MHSGIFRRRPGRSERWRAEGYREGKASMETRVFIVFPPVTLVRMD